MKYRDKLTPHQHMINTVKMMEQRKKERLRGQQGARDYSFEQAYRNKSRKDKIRFKSYRG